MMARKLEKRAGRPKGTAKNRRAVRESEYKLFLKRLEEDESISPYRKEWTRKAACLLYNGGFRVSEITRLTCDDLCDAVATRRIELTNSTKTKKPRTVYLTSVAVERIEQLFEKELLFCGDKLIFHGRGGSYDQVNVTSFTEQLNQLLKKYLNGNYTTHSFRSGLVTDLIQNHGVKIAQKIIGHKSINTTLRYEDVTEDELLEAMENVRGTSKKQEG
jgi:integrase